MSEITSNALETALSYFRAWTAHDFDRAMGFLAPDLVCHAPNGQLNGASAFRGFMEPFTQMLIRADLVAAFGDDHTALLMYDTQTALVPDAPGAECLTVEDGLITRIKIIFDRAPFAAARASGGHRR